MAGASVAARPGAVDELVEQRARQSVQAAGPAALASASVRARSRSSRSRLPSTAVDQRHDRLRVVGVAAGGQVDQGEVLADERARRSASSAGQPHPA